MFSIDSNSSLIQPLKIQKSENFTLTGIYLITRFRSLTEYSVGGGQEIQEEYGNGI